MTGARVVATQRLPGPALAELKETARLELWPNRGTPPRAWLLETVADAEGLLCLLTDRIDRELLDAAPRLRVVSTVSVGVDHVDLDAATERGLPVGHTPGVLTETTADFTFALILAAARRVAEADRFVRAGSWTPDRVWEPDMLLGRDVHGATLGLVGLGAIGRAVARRAQGFGMHVLAWNRTPRPVAGVRLAAFDDVVGRSDFLSLHVALCPETRNLVDAGVLARMKPGAILINAARGGIVDEKALARSLSRGELGGAGLDVFDREPLAPGNPLAGLANVVLAPHIGSASRATRARMAELAVANLRAGLAGERLPHCANGAVYEAEG